MSGGANLASVVHQMTAELREKDKVINQLQQLLRNQSALLFQQEHTQHMVTLTAAALSNDPDDPEGAVHSASLAMEQLKDHYDRLVEAQAVAPKEAEVADAS